MNPACPRCGAKCSAKFGHYVRKDDAQTIQRYRCMACLKCHSSATHTPTYRQKRRRLNRLVEMDIASSTSQRRIAIKHKCDRKTVARKIVFLAEQARIKTAEWMQRQPLFDHVQWDELITFEHTRLKPVSVAVMSSVQHRCIIGFGVAQIPATGVIAKRSREKYGHRANRSGAMRRRVLAEVKDKLTDDVLIESDEHPRYAQEIKQILPNATHVQHRSVRGSLTGQGELKRTGYDPLFSINHTLAMMRDNIKRLARRTWCTTKRKDALNDILAIYMHYHNTVLIPDIESSECTY
jgi:hypothetical protein